MRLKCDESDEFWNFVRDYDIEKPFSEYGTPPACDTDVNASG
jgi:hypothetical protein